VGPKNRECRFVEVGWDFLGAFLGSQALRWRVPGSVLGAVGPSDALLGC
jgi:hypothetical protein